MAVVFTEGFDYYNGFGTSTTTTVGVRSRWLCTNTNSLTPGRFGGQALLVGTPNDPVNAQMPSTYNSGCVGFAYRMSSIGSNDSSFGIFGVSAGNTAAAYANTPPQFYFNVNTSMLLEVRRGGGTVIATATTPIAIGAWCYIETEFVISDTVGELRVYLNNNPTPVINISGVDTKGQTASGFNFISFCSINVSGVACTFDDVYVTDTPTHLGEQRIITSYVNGDSSTDFWTSSTGGAAPYTMLDEITCDADVTYVSSNTFNSRIVLTVPALPVPPTTVNAVRIVGFARKDETQLRQIALEYQNTAGAVSTGSTYTLNTSYVYMQNLYAQNPLTGNPWTATDVNSMKIGARVVT